MKFKVIKEHEDIASDLRLGDIIEIDTFFLKTDVINLGGAHYKISELREYFAFMYDPILIETMISEFEKRITCLENKLELFEKYYELDQSLSNRNYADLQKQLEAERAHYKRRQEILSSDKKD